jgi:hypothetical protein
MNSTAVYKDDMEIFLKEIRESLQKAEDENSLLAVADKISGISGLGELICSHRYEDDLKIIINLLREKIFSIFLNNLQLNLAFFKLHPLFDSKEDRLPPHSGMLDIKRRLLFDYVTADSTNKAIISFFVLLIDILNNEKEKGFADFLIHSADDYIFEVQEFVEIIHLLKITPEKIIDIYIDKILPPCIFMKKTINAQKSSLLMLRHLGGEFSYHHSFARLYEPLKLLLSEAIRANNIELVLYIGFYARYFYSNLIVTDEAYKRLDEEIEKPMSDFFVRYCKDNNIPPCSRIPKKDKKIKIGYAYQQLASSSPVSVLLSLLKGHALNKNHDIEFYVYSYDYKEKAGDNKRILETIRSMGFKCISAGYLGNFNSPFYSHIEKAMALRKRIMDDEIDIFVTTGTQIGNFLITSRVAPIQIYWSHIDPYWNVNNLDCRIIHYGNPESIEKGLYRGVEYFKFSAPVAMELLDPPVSIEEIENLRKKFPADKVILGFLGRLSKLYDQEYLSVVSEILKLNPEAVFLICGAGDNEPIKKYFENAGCIDRVYFEGYVNAHVYGHIIDIGLNPFPSPMGNAANELLAKGKPVVSMISSLSETEEIRNFILRVKRDQIGGEIWADSIEEYIKIAGDFIKDKDCRDKVGKKEQKIIRRIYDCQKSASQLETLFISLAEGKS